MLSRSFSLSPPISQLRRHMIEYDNCLIVSEVEWKMLQFDLIFWFFIVAINVKFKKICINKSNKNTKQNRNIQNGCVNVYIIGSICQWRPLKNFDWPFPWLWQQWQPKICCHWNKVLVPPWGFLTFGMQPCGWHRTTNVVIPFCFSPIFHPATFVFHLEKQNCSPFSSYENMVSQKALREVSITGMGV